MTKYDVIVIGAGSGGIGAALAAARLGSKVLLLEKNNFIGGNAAVSGVSVWEMGAGGTGIPFDIYKKLKKISNAVGIYRINKHRKWQMAKGDQPLHPGAELVIDPSLKYVDTLRRFGSGTGISNEVFASTYWHGVPFEPSAYQEVVVEMLNETQNCTLLTNTSFEKVSVAEGRISSLLLSNQEKVSARTFIDATDNAVLCQAVGCTTVFGQERRAEYNEPDAPELRSEKVNGVSLIFRVRRKKDDSIDPIPGDVPADCWWAPGFPPTSIVQYPNGDFNVNMLPTMEGTEYREHKNKEVAYAECKRRVLAHWHHVQTTYPPYRFFTISWLAASLGVREGPRVIGEYVLTQRDLLLGLSGQRHADIVTIADHAMDTHGLSTGRQGCKELEQPYGVPYRCLQPKGFKNLLIASRAASFSSIAASSCRLSRTMIQLGQAAGTASFLAMRGNSDVVDVSWPELQTMLKAQHVQLQYPADTALIHYLETE